MKQSDLFNHAPPARYPDVPGHRGVDTQIAAAEKIKPCKSRLHKLILAHLNERDATRQEIADALGLKLQTVCGRVRELVLAGELTDTETTRGGGKVVRRV